MLLVRIRCFLSVACYVLCVCCACCSSVCVVLSCRVLFAGVCLVLFVVRCALFVVNC